MRAPERGVVDGVVYGTECRGAGEPPGTVAAGASLSSGAALPAPAGPSNP